MKIFELNMKTGKRGKELANVFRPSFSKGFVDRGILFSKYDQLEYASREDRKAGMLISSDYCPEKYGVEAICFCVGRYNHPASWEGSTKVNDGWCWNAVVKGDHFFTGDKFAEADEDIESFRKRQAEAYAEQES